MRWSLFSFIEWNSMPEFSYAPTTPFEKTILEDPLDDGVRLVLADYLEEQGAVHRARFIRSQVRLAQEVGWQEAAGPADGQRPPAHWTRSQVQLLLDARRSYARLRLHQESLMLCGDLTPAHLHYWRHLPTWEQWRRGFLQYLRWLSVDEFLTYGKSLFSLQPFLEVQLTGRSAHKAVHGDVTRWEWCFAIVSRGQWFSLPAYYLPLEVFNIACGLYQVPRSLVTEDAEATQLFPHQHVGGSLFFSSQDQAQRYLSVACVVWGRRQAKLPVTQDLIDVLLHSSRSPSCRNPS
jgi:uncharacterized protein (TIGR02996 family)